MAQKKTGRADLSTPWVAVILCGGSGSRLWPRSRALLPKPFIPLPDGGGRLIDRTYARLAASPSKPAAAITVVAADYAFLCQTSFARHGPDDVSHWVIAEPAARNTGPAVAVATALCRRRLGDETAMLVLPSDHTMKHTGEFWRTARHAMVAARDGRFVLMGVTPDHPATAYGYIQRGEPLSAPLYSVRRFVEKPDRERAGTFFRQGDFYWNAGIFCFTARTLIKALPELAPGIAAHLTQALAVDSADPLCPDKAAYDRFPAISFDRAIMEKATDVAVTDITGHGWSDVGTWPAITETLTADADGNRVTGEACLLDSTDCLILGGHRLVAAVGARDLHIIDSPDALLVASADQSHRAGEIFRQLRGRDEAEAPTTVPRPWGSYTVLATGRDHKVKRIDVDPGARLSLQSHARRSEHWIGITGTMTVTVEERTFEIKRDQSCFIPCGTRHRMANNTSLPAAVIEVQTGDYLGEDDITRYEDMYGRAPGG